MQPLRCCPKAASWLWSTGRMASSRRARFTSLLPCINSSWVAASAVPDDIGEAASVPRPRGGTVPRLLLPFILLAGFASVAPALGQSTPEACAEIAADVDRLSCYDGIFRDNDAP